MASSYSPSAVMWTERQVDAGIAFIILATLFSVSRFSTRWAKDNVPIWWDDYLIVPSFIAIIALCVLNIVSNKATLELLYQTEPDDMLEKAWVRNFMSSYIFSAIYPIACALPKLSICCLYLRIFTAAHPIFRLVTKVLMAFLFLNMVAFFVPSAMACNPPSAYWAYPQQLHRCLDLAKLGTWINLPHLVTDLIMVAMPMPMIWKMHQDKVTRIGLTIVFLAGGVGIIGGFIRFAIYINTVYVLKSSSPELQQIESLMSLLEPTMYFIAACLPPILGLHTYKILEWLFKRVTGAFSTFSSTFSGRRGSSGAPNSKDSSSKGPSSKTALYEEVDVVEKGIVERGGNGKIIILQK